MAIQYSIQKMVSDGTLSTIALGIQYLQRNDIYMRIAGEETPQSGAPSGYTWSFINNTALKILPVVPNGVEVVVYRRTDVDAMYNVYSQNAQFDEATIDENNQQLLYIAQEYLEQGIPGAGVDTLEFVRDDGTYTYYRIKRTDGSYSDEFAVPSAGSVTKIFAREALRRSYAEAGYNLVAGSFEVGGALVNANDVLLHEASGKAFTGHTGTVAAGTDPTSGGFVDRSTALLREELLSDNGFDLVKFKRKTASSAIRYALYEKANETNSAFEWNVRPSLSDATSEINAAILDIYKLKQNILSDDEIYSVTLRFDQGVDYHILGTVIIPSGVILDFCGSRVIGPDAAAGGVVYAPTGSKMFITGRYEGGAIVSNLDASSEVVKRVIGSGVRGATIINSNCPFDLVNFQEMCFLDDLRLSNCSLMMRTKGSFYARYGNSIRPLICRTTAQATGQPAVLIHGAAAHQLKFDCRIVNASIGYEVTATNSFDVEISGSLEEGRQSGSIGVRNNGAYCQSWSIKAYFEGVDVGITGINNGTFNGCLFAPQYFSSCNYSFKAQASTFRRCRVMCPSIPDEGGGGRNLADFSAPNNDVIFDVGSKGSSTSTGSKEYPTNILLGAGCLAEGVAYHLDDSSPLPLTDALAYAQPAKANHARLNTFAFEGSQIVTKPNQVPFCSITAAVNTLIVDTQITYDESNILAFNLRGGTDATSQYTLSGFIFGNSASWVDHTPASVSLVVSNNTGVVRLTFTNLPALVPIINVSGCVRHV